jgi:hypothetical protein
MKAKSKKLRPVPIDVLQEQLRTKMQEPAHHPNIADIVAIFLYDILTNEPVNEAERGDVRLRLDMLAKPVVELLRKTPGNLALDRLYQLAFMVYAEKNQETNAAGNTTK